MAEMADSWSRARNVQDEQMSLEYHLLAESEGMGQRAPFKGAWSSPEGSLTHQTPDSVESRRDDDCNQTT